MRRVILALLLPVVFFSCKDSTTNEASTTEPLVKDATKPPPAEFADMKYVDMGKEMLKNFENGNIDAWMGGFSDNAVFQWSAGDSLAGKKAIADYWNNRRKNVIETIKFSNDIWLPIKVNQPQKGPDAPGVWLLNWYQINVKYKTGKDLQFWVHNTYHYNDQNKIDRAVQYIDKAPINAAMSK